VPFHRGIFSSAEEAQRRAAAAVERLTASYRSDAHAAGAIEPTTAPTSRAEVHRVTDPPLGALPAGTPPYASVDWSIGGPDGRRERAVAVLPRAQAEGLLSPTTGRIELQASTWPMLTARAALPRTVRIETVGVTPRVEVNAAEFSDQLSGKRFRNAAVIAARTTAGVLECDVAEVSASEGGELTHGAILDWTSPPENFVAAVRVLRMVDLVVPSGVTLRDPKTGRLYSTGVAGVAASVRKLAGDTSADAQFAREGSDGRFDADSIAVGTSLVFEPPQPNIARVAVVKSTVHLSVPKGAVLTYSEDPSRSYETIAYVEIGDRRYATVGFVARERGSASNVEPWFELNFEAPPPGLSPAALIHETTPAGAFPDALPPEIVGAGVVWTSHVHRLTDGRWAADVFTLPMGT
jgi:hypothetical protein